MDLEKGKDIKTKDYISNNLIYGKSPFDNSPPNKSYMEKYFHYKLLSENLILDDKIYKGYRFSKA